MFVELIVSIVVLSALIALISLFEKPKKQEPLLGVVMPKNDKEEDNA